MNIKDIDISNNNMISLVTLDKKNVAISKTELIIKRVIDVIGSIFGIIVLIPLTIGIYIANLMYNDKGSIFYCQERIGLNGKKFKMYKYRSMIDGADEKLYEYLKENEEAREEYKKYKKLKNDPRITKLGKFLRKTSLDEFPQFINVLKGEMSLVGPRPYLEREKKDMNGYFQYITSCKPGITGLWQVNGRSEVSFEDRINLDMAYYYNHNLKLDLKILFRTAKKLIEKEGAI